MTVKTYLLSSDGLLWGDLSGRGPRPSYQRAAHLGCDMVTFGLSFFRPFRAFFADKVLYG